MAAVKERILIGVAWPYANNEPHLGHYAGALLPPDIFARYHRLKGNEVLMVSGSDSHGTPITVSADAEGITPREVVEKYHERFISSFEKMGITFDLYTTTMTENHFSVVHDMFKRHLEKGLIYKQVTKQIFDPKAGRFLPDRYVEGTCPHCGFVDARGDQCDQCGKTYEAVELKNPRSKVTGSKDLEVRDTEHFFLDLAKLNEPLIEWINDGEKAHWRPHVLNFTRAQLEKRDLHGRAITRDIEWGVTIPVAGYDGKRLYVWYEAVIGYLSASREWARVHGFEAEAWEKFWKNPGAGEGTKSYYFIGK
ncbi:MAG: methionine--tRNA ligase, partial [Microbacteriaceae bacterium]|nr:methionine--tRNA ligase [Microbacteriaceae bacterium]